MSAVFLPLVKDSLLKYAGLLCILNLTLVKRVSEFADAVCKANPNDFCNSGAYNIDKIVWKNCSDYDTDEEKKKKNLKEEFFIKLAEAKQQE